jgi:phosphopantothenoylcysteine decarboxylase/phosphopantothenate--cysteine ligase
MPPNTLTSRRVLLGVTAGIAAYKAAELARLLVQAGAQVQVVMTPAARRFIAPLTFQALTGRPARVDLFDEVHEAAMGHIELARWADLIVIAPASADVLARLAGGMANDLLTTLCLASAAPIAVAPAMNQQMWRQAVTQENLECLRRRGFRVFGPASGEQACGDEGPGRLLQPQELLAAASEVFGGERLVGVKAVVTAGPTREPVDPVRFIGNRSSGRMGFAVARALAREGAEVVLVAGPVIQETPPGVRRVDVETAQQMHAAVMSAVGDAQLFVGIAAVADYRPAQPAASKIKKTADMLGIDLVRNPDILADVGHLRDGPFTVGFAAETDDLADHAESKRRAKRVDMIAANLVGQGRLGFESIDNSLLVLWEGGQTLLPVQPKARLAEQLVAIIAERFHASTTDQNPG